MLSLLLVALVPFYLGYGYWHSPAAPHQQLTLGLLAGAFLVNALCLVLGLLQFGIGTPPSSMVLQMSFHGVFSWEIVITIGGHWVT